MTELEVDVFDADGKKLATYGIPLGGAMETQDVFKVEALQNAVEDKLISEADKASCIVKIRLPPNVPPPAGWE